MKNYRSLNQDLRSSMPSQPQAYYELFDHLGEFVERIITSVLAEEVDEVSIVPGGLNAAVVRLKGRGADLKIKIPSDRLIMPEVYFLRQLNKHHIPAPKVIDFSVDDRVIPFPFMITEWISGVQSFAGADEQTKVEGGRVYGEILNKVHAIPVGGYGAPLDPDGESWSADNWPDALRQFLAQTIQLDQSVFSRIEYDEIMSLTVQNEILEIEQPRLIHGDPPNSLMRVKPRVEMLGLVDPSSMVGGNPLFDWSSIYCVNEDGDLGQEFMDGMAMAYGEAEQNQPSFAAHRLFHYFWKTCYFYDHGWKTDKLKRATLHQLQVARRIYG